MCTELYGVDAFSLYMHTWMCIPPHPSTNQQNRVTADVCLVRHLREKRWSTFHRAVRIQQLATSEGTGYAELVPSKYSCYLHPFSELGFRISRQPPVFIYLGLMKRCEMSTCPSRCNFCMSVCPRYDYG